MTKDDNTPVTEPGVDRSRLKLLGVLAAASATGGCVSAPAEKEPEDPLGNLKRALDPANEVPEPAGGEGGGEGGGH